MAMMNGYTNQANKYKEQQVLSATPEEVLLLLYDGAIRFLLIAKKGMEANDIEKSHNNLIKTQNIITEFMVTLDFEVGGETAQNLYNLYEYLHYRLVQANLKKDVTMVDEVLDHLRSLKKTWQEAIQIAGKERTQDRSDLPLPKDGEPHDPPSYTA